MSITARLKSGILQARKRLSSATSFSLFNSWKSLTHFYRHVAMNILIGVSLAILLHHFHHHPTISYLEDIAMDWMVRMFAESNVNSVHVKPFVYLDIDENSYRSWNEPLVIPRDKLAGILEFALDSDPAMIIIDIDLSRTSDEGDAVLQRVLSRYRTVSEDVDANDNPTPPVILARTFRRADPMDINGHLEQRTSFLDPLVSASPRLNWASALFQLDTDMHVRRWRLFEYSCQQERIEVVPSIQLLAASIITGSEDFSELLRSVSKDSSNVCKADDDSAHVRPQRHATPDNNIRLGANTVSVSRDRLSSRILFSLAPHTSSRFASAARTRLGEDSVPVVMRIPVSHFTHDAAEQIDRSIFKNRIVLIGGSFDDSKDHYQTPLGNMPGSMIIINAIDSLLRHGSASGPSLWMKLVVEVFLIIVMSILFARMHSFWGLLASGVIVILVLLPVSFLLFRHGVWLDFVIPLLAVQLHAMAAQFEEAIKK